MLIKSIIENIVEYHENQVAYYEKVLKYTKHSVKKKIAKRNLEFHKWIIYLLSE